MQRLLAVSHVLIAAAANAAPGKCVVPGEPVHWAADYCLYAAETDDFENPKVAECFSKQPEVPAAKACSAKVKYKTDICRVVVRHGSYKGTVAACVRNKAFSGPTVRNGGL
jgi:hypothetical protein